MEDTHTDKDAFVRQMYSYASGLFKQGMTPDEVKAALLERGMDDTNATYVVDSFDRKPVETPKDRAKKDLLYGALWCIGGIVLTMAHIGYIFWGAILFGAIQFIRGLSNL